MPVTSIIQSSAEVDAWQQIIDLATADGWTAVWDPTNLATLTLRSSGADNFAVGHEDGMGNLGSFAQSDPTEQLQHIAGYFGDLDALVNATGDSWDNAVTFTAVSQPDSWALVFEYTGGSTATNERLVSGPGSNKRIIRYNNGNLEVHSGSTFVSAGSITPNTKHVFAATFNGASTVVILDGAESTISSPGTATLDSIGLFNSFGASAFPGALGPLCLATGGVSLTDLRSMSDKLHELSGVPKA